MNTRKEKDESRISQQYNERIIRILNDFLSETEVSLHPSRSQNWDDKYALLVVKYQEESLIIPVPVLKKVSPELAEKIRARIDEELKAKTSERLIEERTQNLLGETFFQAKNFALSLECYMKAGNSQKVGELADLFWSKEYINRYDGDKFLQLAVEGYEYLGAQDKLKKIGDYRLKHGTAIRYVVPLFQKAGATAKILTLGEAAAKEGDEYGLEAVYKALNTPIPKEKLIQCGDTLFTKKQFYSALKCYEKANYKEGRKRVARQYLASKNKEKIEEAVGILRALGILEKNLAVVGDAHHRIGSKNEALEYYRKAGATKRIAKLAKAVETWRPKWALELYEEIGEISQEKYLEIAHAALKEQEFKLVAYCYQKAGQKLPEKEILQAVDKAKQDTRGSIKEIIEAYEVLGAKEKLTQFGRDLLEEKYVEGALIAFRAAGYQLSKEERSNIGDIFVENGYFEPAVQMYKGSKSKLARLVQMMLLKDKTAYLSSIVEACKEGGFLDILRALAKDYGADYYRNRDDVSKETKTVFRAIAELELKK